MSDNNQSQQANTVKAKPVQADERLEFVDILRGFAVFGILVANMVSFSGQHGGVFSWDNWLDRGAVLFTEFFVRAKFYSLFSLLFGWGMAVQMRRAEARGSTFLPVYLKRLLILLAFGLIHGIFIWYGDILTTYALFGFALLLFRKRSTKTILLASALSLAFAILLFAPVMPIETFREWYGELVAPLQWNRYPQLFYAEGTYWEITLRRAQDFFGLNAFLLYFFGNVFAMFLVGLYIGRRELFKKVREHQGLLKGVMWSGLVIGVLFNGFFIATHYWRESSFPAWIPNQYANLAVVGSRSIGAPAMTLFYVAAIITLTRNQRWHERLAPLAHVGRMALTNYILQSVIGTLIFYNYGLGLYGEFGPAFGLALTITIYYMQVRFSAWWFDRYQFGPLEWLWRTLTYGRRQPVRYDETYADIRPVAWVERLRGLKPVTRLTITWALLAFWALGLAYGHARLGRSSEQGAEAQAGVDPGLGQVFDLADGNDGSAIEEETIPPEVEPAAFDPGPIVASGDLPALAGTFDAAQAVEQIQTLSGPPYYGRGAGTAEGYAAAEYIAEQFAAYGLQPAGDGGTFFQVFPFDYFNVSATPQLSIHGPDGDAADEFVFHEDYSSLILGYLGGGSAEGDVVWANACEPRDFAGLDTVGKIVFCREGASYNIGRNAIEHGAAGLLLLADPEVRPMDFGPVYRETWVPETIPALRLAPEAAASLMTGSGKTLEDLSIGFFSFPLATRASFSVPVAGNESCAAGGANCQARNVLGVIPGRDPEYADEVVIVGGHYDHLGETPGDAVVWPGANDNASGIAVMLEIARNWQEQGYVPRRTVLFAAWDAEELGLFGSSYYAQHPRYPLENTVGVVTMDMVGAGTETMLIDGSPGFADYMAGIAEDMGIETEIANLGRSDHVPFIEKGVPAALMIWWGGEGEIPHYHRPLDTPEVIEPEKLAASGRIANLALLGLTEAEPEIAALIEKRAEAIRAGDLDAFLATSAPEQAAYDQSWFAQTRSVPFSELTIAYEQLQFYGDEATATVHYALTPDGDAARTINTSLEVRFARGESGWQWAGPDLALARSGEVEAPTEEPEDSDGADNEEPALAGVAEEDDAEMAPTGFSVYQPEGSEADLSELGQSLSIQYNAAATTLGLPANPQASVLFFTRVEALRADTGLSLPANLRSWVGPGRIKLVYQPPVEDSPALRTALAQLLLVEAGVTADAAPWLWEGGLGRVLAAREDVASVHRQLLPGLRGAIASSETASETAYWAATDFLQRRLGWRGLGSFIRDLGRLCRQGRCETGGDGLDAALRASLGYGEEQFEKEWRADWLGRLERAQADLDAVVAARVESVLTGDANAFRETVDAAVATLLVEEQAWFEDLSRYPVEEFSLSARPLVLYPNGDILASINGEYRISGLSTTWRDGAISATALFTRRGGSLRLAGPEFVSMSGRGINLYYPAGSEDRAEQVLAEAEEIYAQAAELLGTGLGQAITIKLYESDNEFRYSVYLSFPLVDWLPGWTAEGQSVKLRLQGQDYHAALATYVTRQLLTRMGVESEWLFKAAVASFADEMDNQAVSDAVGNNLHRLSPSYSRGDLHALEEFPTDDNLDRAGWGAATAQAWDHLKYLSITYGEDVLPRLIAANGRGQSIEAALQSVTGQPAEQIEAAWAESLARAHTTEAWVGMAEAFDEGRALDHVEALTDDDLVGRQAGSSGAQLAAEYIAARFADYGLLPLGDALDENAGEDEAADGQTLGERSQDEAEEQFVVDGVSYFQHFPIEYSTLLAAPIMQVWNEDGEQSEVFGYKEDFVLALNAYASWGEAEAEMVWIWNEPYEEDINLNGKIAVRVAQDEVDQEIQWAIDHGAGGLILVLRDDYRTQKHLVAKAALPVEYAERGNIPVVVVGNEGYIKFLDWMDMTPVDVGNLPPALPTGMLAKLSVQMSEPQEVAAVNVLGYIPGSDPELRREVIILGAHYDHVGDDPDALLCGGVPIDDAAAFDDATCERAPGRQYSGANDNAAGVGVLLEIARIWHESGYQPKRTVIFAAWGAQEAGQTGSTYFVEHPTTPLENIAATIQLDSLAGGGGFYLIAQGEREHEGEMIFTIETANELLDGRLIIPRESLPGDQLPFQNAGIPSMLVSWRDASEDNWPDGIADEVLPERVSTAGRLVLLTLLAMAR